jgi:hypothetical protein
MAGYILNRYTTDNCQYLSSIVGLFGFDFEGQTGRVLIQQPIPNQRLPSKPEYYIQAGSK